MIRVKISRSNTEKISNFIPLQIERMFNLPSESDKLSTRTNFSGGSSLP